MDVRGALKAQNIEYVSGGVLARHGFKAITAGIYGSTNYAPVAMYCWYAPFSEVGASGITADSSLVILTANGLLTTNNGTGTQIAITGTLNTCAGGTIIGVGLSVYAAGFDSSQHGLSANRSTMVSTFFNLAGAFSIVSRNALPCPPSSVTPTTSEPGAGVVTAGVHRLGYLIEYASGFTTRVSPDSGTTTPPSISTFQPISVTASGSKNLRVAFGSAIAVDAVALSIVMTTTTNLNQYYIVPGSRTPVGNPMTIPTNIDVSISDADLSSQGLDATQYLYWLTANGGATPFSVRHLCLFGDRLAWLGTAKDSNSSTIDALYISERNNYQAFTADQHILQLPGQRPITTMFRMGTSNYILGPHEIWAALDNGDVPVTWSAPYLIDGRHGTLSIHGVEVAPSGQYAWIADQSGLYLFAGSPITSLPVSYQQTPHWNRINWSSAYCIKIKDDASNKKVYVMVPLDGATTPSHMMVFDYTDGATWQAVRYSLDNLSGYALGAMELVRNDLTGQATGNQQRIELWLGSSSANPILRRTTDQDTTPFRDSGAAINSIYRTCPLPGRDQAGGVIQMHHGFHARLKGSGSITPVMYDTDSIRSFTCRTATLSTTPDADLLFAADLRGEVAAVEFNTNTLDTYWTLAYLRYYHSPYIMQR